MDKLVVTYIDGTEAEFLCDMVKVDPQGWVVLQEFRNPTPGEAYRDVAWLNPEQVRSIVETEQNVVRGEGRTIQGTVRGSHLRG